MTSGNRYRELRWRVAAGHFGEDILPDSFGLRAAAPNAAPNHCEARLRILVLSWFFPPSNTIAAVRLGKLSRFLIRQGHDVRVITAGNLPYQQTLHLDLPEDRVTYTPWRDVNRLPSIVKDALKRLLRLQRGDPDTATSAKSDGSGAPPSWIGKLYRNVVNFPDSSIGWLPSLLKAARQVLRDWRPDAIFASAPPFTTLLGGYLVAKWHRVPLVVEFRDRWHDDPYYPPPAWRAWINGFAERRIVRQAVAITTVSEPWAVTYRQRYGKPVAVIYNGFDRELCPAQASPAQRDTGVLRIVYTGGIYPGRRDPSPLFAAMNMLADDRRHVRADFYGTNRLLVLPLVERQGVADLVTVHPRTPHEEAVLVQQTADVLLLMQWNDPKEQGNVPGKFFEYLGVLRPILVLGLENGVPATIVRERGAGFFSNDPAELAAQLRKWIRQKRELGFIPAVPDNAREGFSRDEQFAKLEGFLGDVIQPSPERVAAIRTAS